MVYIDRYLYAFDLGMSSPALTIFNIDTHEPVMVTSIQTNDKDTHGKRLGEIREYFLSFINEYTPYEIAIERGFSRFNTSTQVTFRVHGVINEAFKDCKQFYYPPKSVKESIVMGNSSKEVVRKAIEKRYTDMEFTNEDESDSFAVGVTHLIKCHGMKWEKFKPEKKTTKKKTTKTK